MPVNVSFVSTMTISNKTDGPIVLRYPEFVCAKGMSSVEVLVPKNFSFSVKPYHFGKNTFTSLPGRFIPNIVRIMIPQRIVMQYS